MLDACAPGVLAEGLARDVIAHLIGFDRPARLKALPAGVVPFLFPLAP